MPALSSPLRPTVAWSSGAALGLALVVGMVLPALATGALADGAHALFAAVCHQLPDRSFTLHAGPLALCHRCTGLLVGLVAAFLASPVVAPAARGIGRRALSRVPRHHRMAVALCLAAIPTTLDWALGASGLLINTPLSRFSTALLLGAVAGLLIADGLLRPSPRPHPPAISDAR